MDENLGAQFLDSVRFRFDMYRRLGEGALAQLSDDDLGWVPDAGSNSVGLIIQHLHGNMVSRWTNFLTEDGEKPKRDRDAEFIAPQRFVRAELMREWDEGWRCLLGTMDALRPDDLLRTVIVRGNPLTALDGILRQLAHVAYHVGQITWIAKARAGESWTMLSIPRGESRNPDAAGRLERDYGSAKTGRRPK